MTGFDIFDRYDFVMFLAIGLIGVGASDPGRTAVGAGTYLCGRLHHRVHTSL
jgi:hypothetical protein